LNSSDLGRRTVSVTRGMAASGEGGHRATRTGESIAPNRQARTGSPGHDGSDRAIGLPLSRHLDPVPEGDAALYRCGRLLRFGVVPGGVLVDLSIDDDIVVAGVALPGAMAVRTAGPEVLLPDRIWREVVIAFDDDRIVALGQDRIFPGGLHG